MLYKFTDFECSIFAVLPNLLIYSYYIYSEVTCRWNKTFKDYIFCCILLAQFPLNMTLTNLTHWAYYCCMQTYTIWSYEHKSKKSRLFSVIYGSNFILSYIYKYWWAVVVIGNEIFHNCGTMHCVLCHVVLHTFFTQLAAATQLYIYVYCFSLVHVLSCWHWTSQCICKYCNFIYS